MLQRKSYLHVAIALAFASSAAMAQTSGLPQEIRDREAADAQLQNNIDAETAARALGEARLQGAIDTEAGTRAAADTRLQSQIDELRSSSGGGGGTANVDCGSGGSVSQALASGATQINIRGTCNESLNVDRDGVTLHGEPGATIHGPDADVNTINVRGNRVTIDGLTVTGGRNGITALGAANLTVRNCNVQSTGRTGISFVNGSSGTVDGCVVQSNARDGIAVDGAQATIINSTVTSNARNGVLIVTSGSGRVGLTDRLTGAGNTITQNGGPGVTVAVGSAAFIAMNTISDNGINPSLGRSGIAVTQSTASITGGNTITRNAGQGVLAANGASVLLGDPAVGIPTVNTISANGSASSPGGVNVFLGSTMVLRDAVIEQNNGPGIAFTLRSQGQIFSSTIRNNLDVPVSGGVNPGDGIRLILGSALLPSTPGSTVTGNAGVGLQCNDAESSAINTFAPFLSFAGNLRGDVPNCSGF